MIHTTTRTSIEPRPNDYDVLGHVNHAVALEYLEVARRHWFRSNGFHPSDVVPVVLKVEVDYNRELVRGPFRVDTTFDDQAEAVYKAHFDQRILLASPTGAGTGMEAIRARVTCAFIDVASRAPRSFEDFAERARDDGGDLERPAA